MNWYKVAEFPVTADLTDIHTHFQQQGVVHRFTERGGKQELWVAEQHNVAALQQFLERWQQGDKPEPVPEPDSPGPTPAAARKADPAAFKRYPFTLISIALGVAGYLLVAFFTNSALLPALSFQPFRSTILGLEFEPLGTALARGEIWRLVTPAFLHFNVLHIVFNSLWVWEFGRRLEIYLPRWQFLLVFFVTAISANFMQYFSADNALFGGLSGVLYGYLGVLFVAHRIAPHPVLAIPPGIFVFMFIWLALGLLGVIDLFIPGPAAVGNGAHLGGLFAGLVLGYILFGGKDSAR